MFRERDWRSYWASATVATLTDNWFRILVGSATVLLTLATVGRFVFGPYLITDDSALFQHADWYIAQGATPYIDFWDLKLPLIYAVTTSLALLTGGDMFLLHLASVLVSMATIAAGVALVSLLAYRVTGDELASFAAGLTPPLFLETVLAPVYGVEGYTVVGRLLAVVIQLGYGVLLGPIAVAGWGLAAIRDATRH